MERGTFGLRQGRRMLLASAAIIGFGASLTQPAHAQTVPAPDATASAQDAPAAASDDRGDVVVVGSRITRPDFTAPTPVTSIQAAELENRGAPSFVQVLQQLPAVSPLNGGATTGAANGGLSTVNLRGLGANRTLVLIDGRRHVASGATGVVDLNTIPSVAIGSIDVVTGGASAAYGSDAVAGVVNIGYDRNLRGIKAEAQYGASTHGDNREAKLAVAIGNDFGDGGHFLVAGEWYKLSDGVQQGDRDWGRRNYGIVPNSADTGPADGRPRLLISPDVNLTAATFGGVITSPASLNTIAFGPGGTLIPFRVGANNSGTLMTGGTNAISVAGYPTLSAPIERRSVLAYVDYPIGDSVTAFFAADYADAKVSNPVIPLFDFGNITIQADNAFIPPALQAQLGAATSFRIGRIERDFGVYGADIRRTTFSIAAGLRGTFGSRFKWEASFQHGEFRSDVTHVGNRNTQAFLWAVDAVRNPANPAQPVCRVTLNLAAVPAALQGLASQCQPLNLFGEGSPSEAAKNYVYANASLDTQLKQTVAAGEVSGDVVDLWAGPLSIAAGGEYRKESVAGQTDAASLAGLLALSNARSTQGGFHVTEVFGEAALPVLRDVPGIEKLELNGAVRYADYSTIGSVTTWKGGAVWTPTSGILVRAAISRDIRAPNINELFAPGVTAQFTPNDHCATASQAANATVRANCAAAGIPATFTPGVGGITTAQIGATNLEAERATTKTLGAVLSPGFLSGLRVSADWYSIRLKGAIGLLANQAILDACYKASSALACSTISRDPTTRVLTRIDRTYLNVGESTAKGLDFQVDYRVPLAGTGFGDALNVRLVGNYQYSRKETASGVVTFQIAGQIDPTAQVVNTGIPKLRANLSLDYELGGFSLHPRVRYIGSAKFNNSYTVEDININHYDPVAYFDITASYKINSFGGSVELYGGFNNLFDQDPRIAPNTQFFPYATNTNVYDVIGRTFFVGLRGKF